MSTTRQPLGIPGSRRPRITPRAEPGFQLEPAPGVDLEPDDDATTPVGRVPAEPDPSARKVTGL